MRVAVALGVALLTVLWGAAAAGAQDSDAPHGALAHWIPDEVWVYEHWLPYDETRLYSLLQTDRGRIWRHLRNDAAHDLEQLARRRGMSADQLAQRLVADRRRDVSPELYRLLRDRARRTITQGHLAQHILFHSLHQRTLVHRAREVFGMDPDAYVDLRVDELSPMEIGRLNGLSAVEVRRRAVRELRTTVWRGVHDGAVTRAQAERLLPRQLRQLPRWLGQRRYNGPPRTSRKGLPDLPVADWANHPTITSDGTKVAFDQYRSTIPDARRLGEIRVVTADTTTGRLSEASHAGGMTPGKPTSAYHSALSADGRSVVYESSAGNMNYAKRYGNMRVQLRDLRRNRTVPLGDPLDPGRALPPRTAYNPTVSGDGRVVAYESDGVLWLEDRRAGRSQAVARGSAGATYEPRLSADGRTLVYSKADAGGNAQVYARDVATGRTTLVSRAAGADGAPADGDAYEPSVSGDGRVVAFTSAAGNLGAAGRRARIWVRDVRVNTTEVVSDGPYAFDPAVSASGRHVAFAARDADGDRPAYRRASVWLHDRETKETVPVSRADGLNSEPSVSSDGDLVAFTSTSARLDPSKPAGLTGVFLHDVGAGTTKLLSTHDLRKAPPVTSRKGLGVDAGPWWVCRLHV